MSEYVFKEWKLVRTYYENSHVFQNREVKVSLVARKPVFENGKEGRLKLALCITRENRTLYFPLYDENWDEIRYISSSICSILEKMDEFKDEYFNLVKDERIAYHKRRKDELENSV